MNINRNKEHNEGKMFCHPIPMPLKAERNFSQSNSLTGWCSAETVALKVFSMFFFSTVYNRCSMEIKDFNFLLSRGMLETLSAKKTNKKTQVSHLNNFKNDSKNPQRTSEFLWTHQTLMFPPHVTRFLSFTFCPKFCVSAKVVFHSLSMVSKMGLVPKMGVDRG